MRYQSIKQIAGLGLVFAALAFPSLSRADYTIHSGWDLFYTTSPGTLFYWQQFQGVPLETFDFGGSIGVQNVGNVDTIMYRPTNIIGFSGSTTNFSATMVAWQLQSVGQTDFGGMLPLGNYFLTLDTDTNASTSSGSITFNSEGTGGTFSDTLSVYYDLRSGSLNGDIVTNGYCELLNAGASWTHTNSYPPVITDVNYLLNGTDTSEDFWTGVIRHENDVEGNIHIVPEPSVCSLAVCLGGGLMGLWRMRRKLLRK